MGHRQLHLARRLTAAAADEAERRGNRRADRIIVAFLRDHPDGATRDAADGLLRELESNLEATTGDDAVRSEITILRREFELGSDPLTPVPEFERFRERVGEIKTQRRLGYRRAEQPARPAKAEAPAKVDLATKVEAPAEGQSADGPDA